MTKLIDAVEMHRKFPLDFAVPSPEELSLIYVGDSVRVTDGLEIIWVRLTHVTTDFLEGVATVYPSNELHAVTQAQPTVTRKLRFERRHVHLVQIPQQLDATIVQIRLATLFEASITRMIGIILALDRLFIPDKSNSTTSRYSEIVTQRIELTAFKQRIWTRFSHACVAMLASQEKAHSACMARASLLTEPTQYACRIAEIKSNQDTSTIKEHQNNFEKEVIRRLELINKHTKLVVKSTTRPKIQIKSITVE